MRIFVVCLAAVLAVSASASASTIVVGQRVTVHARTARVPLRCDLGAERCQGTIRSAHQSAQRFSFSYAQPGGMVAVRVPAGATTVRLSVRLTDQSTLDVRRSLLRNAPVRATCAPAWAYVVATGGDAVMWRAAADLDAYRTIVCAPGRPTRVFAAVSQDGGEGIATAGGINPDWAALIVIQVTPGPRGPYEVDRMSLSTGAVTHFPLAHRDGVFEDPEALRVVVGTNGVMAVAEQFARAIRIRLVTDGVDRLLDTNPGIDPDSLATDGSTVTWTRDGAPQSAPLAG